MGLKRNTLQLGEIIQKIQNVDEAIRNAFIFEYSRSDDEDNIKWLRVRVWIDELDSVELSAGQQQLQSSRLEESNFVISFWKSVFYSAEFWICVCTHKVP